MAATGTTAITLMAFWLGYILGIVTSGIIGRASGARRRRNPDPTHPRPPAPPNPPPRKP